MSDETDLFWGEYSDENGLLMHAASKSGGGEVRTLGKWYDYPSAQTLTLDAEYVYWMRDEADGQVVVRVSKQGGDERVYPLPVPEEGGLSLGYIAFVDDELWLITRGCNYVVRMSPDGGQASLLKMSPYKNVGSSTGFVVREGKVYCGNGPL